MSFDITTKEVFSVMKGRVHAAIKGMESLRREIAHQEGSIIANASLVDEKHLGAAGKMVVNHAAYIIERVDQLRKVAEELHSTGGMMQHIHANDGEEKTEAKAAAAPAEDHVAERGDAGQAAEGS